ncbi:hypothetical protein PHMEG_00012409 [Phytophthora megakarya]|uniref:Uncharacterized protein n=1 Tax=Phytophthora megakarya TaxID=4795 RepID=A0A225W9S5_9STRA|nr:hypothetical protein PHMEG_00012409 [Phytophthora megakarya]
MRSIDTQSYRRKERTTCYYQNYQHIKVMKYTIATRRYSSVWETVLSEIYDADHQHGYALNVRIGHLVAQTVHIQHHFGGDVYGTLEITPYSPPLYEAVMFFQSHSAPYNPVNMNKSKLLLGCFVNV